LSERAHELYTSDGLRLRALVSTPSRPPAAALVLIHGLTTNCDEHGAFPALRDRALRGGLAVVRYDGRAHGSSEGSNENLRLAGVRADVHAVAELVDHEFGPEIPVIPLGVSFGGAAAVHLAASRTPCAGLALWYAVIDYAWNYAEDSPVKFTQDMRAARAPDAPAWSAWPVADTGYHIPAGLMDEVGADRTPQTLRALEVPVLAYHGGRDTLVDVEPLRRIAAERPNVELRIAHGAGHGFLLWRPWVIRRTVDWAVSVAGR
jgi:pimeloyl-ACP methyl ester carboxylesterase